MERIRAKRPEYNDITENVIEGDIPERSDCLKWKSNLLSGTTCVEDIYFLYEKVYNQIHSLQDMKFGPQTGRLCTFAS